MATDSRENADLIVFPPDDNEPLAEKINAEKIAGGRNLILAANTEPLPAKSGLYLTCIDDVRRKRLGGKRRGLSERTQRTGERLLREG